MNFYQSTVLELFNSFDVRYSIPVYQRAYSWEEPQWKAFLGDLLEQIQGSSNYFYGNILLKKTGSMTFEIIDGQQRLTTLVIFFRSMLNVLCQRSGEGEKIIIEGNDFDSSRYFDTYLKYRGRIKLRPVEYDCVFFERFIIDDISTKTAETPSQKRIKDAKEFFERQLSKLDTQRLVEIILKIEQTTLTKIVLDGEKDAALMFELQNNRGKNLTNMEKLKSYFMYQMYVYSSPEAIDENIKSIALLYTGIYTKLNEIQKLDEDSILYYHCEAWINGFSYRSIDDVKAEMRQKETNEKVGFIQNFVKKLSDSFDAIKQFVNSSDEYAIRLRERKSSAFVFPFIIKGYAEKGNNQEELTRLFKTLEIVCYRDELVNTRADIISRLSTILNDFAGDNNSLIQNLKEMFSTKYYWSDSMVLEKLNGDMYNNPALKTILLEYEKSLQNRGYKLEATIENPSIEHISPQTPSDAALCKGYEVNEEGNYSEEFAAKYLNSIGNLMLVSQAHNSAIGNQAFSEKLASYNENPLMKQQAEIRDFVNGNSSVWNSECIESRKKKIIDFCLNHWNIDSI